MALETVQSIINYTPMENSDKEYLLALARERDNLTARLAEVTKLAYVGEHHFPENTYKALLNELVPKHRALESRLAEAERERDAYAAEVHRVRSPGRVVIEFDLSPAQTEGRLRDKLIELGWTPPRAADSASPAPDPTCAKCGATVKVLSVESSGWINMEPHQCSAKSTG